MQCCAIATGIYIFGEFMIIIKKCFVFTLQEGINPAFGKRLNGNSSSELSNAGLESQLKVNHLEQNIESEILQPRDSLETRADANNTASLIQSTCEVSRSEVSENSVTPPDILELTSTACTASEVKKGKVTWLIYCAILERINSLLLLIKWQSAGN